MSQLEDDLSRMSLKQNSSNSQQSSKLVSKVHLPRFNNALQLTSEQYQRQETASPPRQPFSKLNGTTAQGRTLTTQKSSSQLFKPSQNRENAKPSIQSTITQPQRQESNDQSIKLDFGKYDGGLERDEAKQRGSMVRGEAADVLALDSSRCVSNSLSVLKVADSLSEQVTATNQAMDIQLFRIRSSARQR